MRSQRIPPITVSLLIEYESCPYSAVVFTARLTSVGELKSVTRAGAQFELVNVRFTLSTRVVVTSSGVKPLSMPPLKSWRPPRNFGRKYCQFDTTSSRRRNINWLLVRLRYKLPVVLSLIGCRLVFCNSGKC